MLGLVLSRSAPFVVPHGNDFTVLRMDDDAEPLPTAPPVGAAQLDHVHQKCRHFIGPMFRSNDAFQYRGTCLAVDFSRQLWVGMGGVRDHWAAQRMNLMMNLAVIEAMLDPDKPLLAQRWDLVVVVPPVWRSFMLPYATPDTFNSGRPSKVKPAGIEVGPHGFRDTIAVDYKVLMSLEAMRVRFQTMAAKTGRTIHVVELSGDIGKPRLAVSMPIAFAGGVVETDPKWHRIGEGWVPWTDRQSCFGGAYEPPARHRGPDGRTTFHAAPSKGIADIAAIMANRLPGRAAAGEGLTIHNLNGCDASAEIEAASSDNLRAVRAAPHLEGVVQSWAFKLSQLANPHPFTGYGAVQLDGPSSVVMSMLPRLETCIRHFLSKDAAPTPLYVWTSLEVAGSDEFRRWRESVRSRLIVVTARDLDPLFMVNDNSRPFPQGRQEFQAVETGLVERATWVAAWHPQVRASWLLCAVVRDKGQPCDYLNACAHA